MSRSVSAFRLHSEDNDLGGIEHMIYPPLHSAYYDIARQRHQDLLAEAEHYRLVRIVRERHTRRTAASEWTKLLLRRAFRTRAVAPVQPRPRL